MEHSSVTEFIGKEVPDWDDEVMTSARFKAFSGQRSDWELRFRFWRDLILRIARHLGVFIIRPRLGVKVSLMQAAVSGITSLDGDVLHLIWTTEKLQWQLDIFDRHYEMSRKSALASLSSGNKKLALRHARELKLATESRQKCSSLRNRVEEVLNVIADAESTKKVSEAIQIGRHAIRENKVTVEDVRLFLEELEEGIGNIKEVEKAMELTPSVTEIENEDIEEEFKKFEKLELEIKDDKLSILGIGVSQAAPEKASSESTELLADALSNLKLGDGPPDSVASVRTEKSKNPLPEAA